MAQGSTAELKPLTPAKQDNWAPVIGGALRKDLLLYMEDMAILAEIQAKLKQMAAGIKNTGNVMFEVILIFAMLQAAQGAKMRALSDVDNVESDIRNDLSTAQGSWNDMAGGASKTQVDAARKLIAEVKEIEDFIKYEKAKGDKSVFDGGMLKNLQTAITSIKDAFDKPCKNSKEKAWGDPNAMARKMNVWLWNQKKLGVPMPAFKEVQDAFQTINQSVSELAATTNTRMQFTENVFKQFLGIMKTVQDAYLKLISTNVRHFNG